MYHLKKWEIALLCALILTLLLTPVLGATPGCAWWGAVYPELTPDAAAQRVSTAEAGGVWNAPNRRLSVFGNSRRSFTVDAASGK